MKEELNAPSYLKGMSQKMSRVLPISLALCISLTTPSVVFAAPGDLNSTNDGAVIQGGTYFNTPGSRTTFQNTGSDTLWLKSDQLVRGLESNASKVPTGNGGTLYFRAPGNVIRLDGTVDVSAIKDGSMYLGNGGKVFVDAAYLYQNGNIFANGVNGGLVQFNVGAATIAPTARITAMGFGGNGGKIAINAAGLVDVQRGAVVDSSGKVIGTYDTNVINIEGGLVNTEGIVRANGVVVTDFKTNSDAAVVNANPQLRNNPVPGTISGGKGTGVTPEMEVQAQLAIDTRGGTIRLVATGQSESVSSAIAASNNLTDAEKTQLNNRHLSLLRKDGDIINLNLLQAKGANSKDGGTIILAAANNIHNYGTLEANGGNGVQTAIGSGTSAGNGGAISINALNTFINHGFIEANGGVGGNAASASVNTGNGEDAFAEVFGLAGRGGNGGLIAFSYKTMDNRGKVMANGGAGGVGGNAAAFDSESATGSADAHAEAIAIAGDGGFGGDGGLIVFSGNGNPTGNGLVQANGGRGGRGGNGTADARAVVQTGTASVSTLIIRGEGGLGGETGTVVAPNPSQFIFSQTYRAQRGGFGNSGTQQHIHVKRQNGVTTVDGEFISAAGGSTTMGLHNTIDQTRRNELLLHEENAFLLSQAGGTGVISDTLSGRLANARLRSIGNPFGTSAGSLETALEAVKHAGNFLIAGINPSDLWLDIPNGNTNPIWDNLNSLTILNRGTINNDMHWSPGVHAVGPQFHDLTYSLGGGNVSWLSTDTINNNGFILTRGLWSGGSTQLAAGEDIFNNKVLYNIAFNKHLASGFITDPGFISSHGGSTVLKAGHNIVNTRRINANLAFFDIHPPLDQNPPIEWPKFLNAAQIGSTIHLLAGNNLFNGSGGIISADVLTYRNGTLGIQNPANGFGGIIVARTGGNVTNNGIISAQAQSFQGDSGPRFSQNTFPEVNSTDGVVDLE